MRWFLNKQRSIGCKNCFTPPVKRKSTLCYFFLRWLLCHPVYRENSFWDQLEIKSSTQNSWKRDQKNKKGGWCPCVASDDTCSLTVSAHSAQTDHGNSKNKFQVWYMLCLQPLGFYSFWIRSATSLEWCTGTPNRQVFTIYVLVIFFFWNDV